MNASSLMKSIDPFLFVENTAFQLGLSRFIFFGTTFFFFVIYMQGYNYGYSSGFFNLPEGLWFPVSYYKMFAKPPLSYSSARIVELIFYVSAFLAAIGFYSRISALIVTLSLGFLAGATYCYGELWHEINLVVLVAGVFACSRSGDGFSIDAWLTNRKDRELSFQKFDIAYGWPYQIIRFLIVSVMFCTALAKLRWSGLNWIFSDTLQNYLLLAYYNGYLSSVAHKIGLGPILAQSKILCMFLAAGTIFIELFSPLALTRRFRWFFALIIIAQISFHFLITSTFLEFIGVYLALVPVEKLLKRRPG
jgi:hypothetical protein